MQAVYAAPVQYVAQANSAASHLRYADQSGLKQLNPKTKVLGRIKTAVAIERLMIFFIDTIG